MGDTIHQLQVTEPTLNTVASGLSLARDIVAALRCGRAVALDMSTVERMTPSFANALVMTILDAVGLPVFRAQLQMSTVSPVVQDAWAKAIERYERGIRLTTQRPGAA